MEEIKSNHRNGLKPRSFAYEVGFEDKENGSHRFYENITLAN